MTALRSADRGDIVELTEDAAIQMKKPHRKSMLKAWEALCTAPPAHPAGSA